MRPTRRAIEQHLYGFGLTHDQRQETARAILAEFATGTRAEKLNALRQEVVRHKYSGRVNPRCLCDGPRACLYEIFAVHTQLFGRARKNGRTTRR